MSRIREKVRSIVSGSDLWDQKIVNVQITDANEHTIEVRALFSTRDSSAASDLATLVRQGLIAFVQTECPHALPRVRNDPATLPSERTS